MKLKKRILALSIITCVMSSTLAINSNALLAEQTITTGGCNFNVGAYTSFTSSSVYANGYLYQNKTNDTNKYAIKEQLYKKGYDNPLTGTNYGTAKTIAYGNSISKRSAGVTRDTTKMYSARTYYQINNNTAYQPVISDFG